MRGISFGTVVAAAVASTSFFVSQVAADIDPIVIEGSKFFYKTSGTQFFIRGIAYQQEYSTNASDNENLDYIDPLADETACRRDVPVLQQLQTNTIRVYAINPDANHDACMNMLQDAGIHVVADLSQPAVSINRASPSWDDELYARYAKVVDALANYTNTLGFFAGNEVSNQPNNTEASAFVKAAVRDMKQYIKQQNYRPIGVGYATNDDAAIRKDIADYFNCGEPENTIDFWGYNIYSWCGESSFTKSGFDVRTEEFSSYNVPIFFAEYGCNEVQPRPFTEVQALYGPNMTAVWSGGIVYMYFQEANDYGLVEVDGDSVSKMADFTLLSSQMAKATPTGVQMNNYQPSNSPAVCPTVDEVWRAVSSPLPPTPNKELCSCMYNSLSCVIRSGVDAEDYGQLFAAICGLGDGSQCDGIAANASAGTYGAYSMCNSTEQLAYAMDAYYQAQSGSNKASACDFEGAAHTQSPVEPSGECNALMQQAGPSGTGRVTSIPEGTGAGAAADGGSGSGSDSNPSSGAATCVDASSLQTGAWQAVSLVTVGLFSGMGVMLS